MSGKQTEHAQQDLRCRRGLGRSRNEVAHKLGERMVQIHHLLRPQRKHMLQSPRRTQTLAQVVDHHVSMLGFDDERQQLLNADEGGLIHLRASGGDGQLFHRRRQTLGEHGIGSLGRRILVVSQEFQQEGQPRKGLLLLAGLRRGRPTALHPPKEFQQPFLPLRLQSGILPHQPLEIILEAQHNLLGLGPGIESLIRGQIVKERQGGLAELAHDALAGHLALDEATVGAHNARGEKQFRLLDQGLDHGRLEGGSKLTRCSTTGLMAFRSACLRSSRLLSRAGLGTTSIFPLSRPTHTSHTSAL